MLALVVSAIAAFAPIEQAAAPKVSVEAPSMWLVGREFPVRLVVESASETQIPAWWLTPAAFRVDGAPLGRRDEGAKVPLAAGARLELRYDLAPHLRAEGGFALDFADGNVGGPAVQVKRVAPVAAETNFMEMPAERLAEYAVVLLTNRGEMMLEVWPDVAPNHARSFLDLAHNRFYDGILFHRVIPGFMIQGGDPNTKDPSKRGQWGMGGGPRKLQAEFNDRKHERGVLSAARLGHDVNSATSQFFIMHRPNPSLDGQYSAFGKLISGEATLDAIATTPRDQGDVPREPQRIEHAFVVEKKAIQATR